MHCNLHSNHSFIMLFIISWNSFYTYHLITSNYYYINLYFIKRDIRHKLSKNLLSLNTNYEEVNYRQQFESNLIYTLKYVFIAISNGTAA